MAPVTDAKVPAQGDHSSSKESIIAVGTVFGGIAVIGLLFGLYGWLDDGGRISHSNETPVWIQGDWLVGEYRDCQMRTKTDPPQRKDIDSLDKLPRLFCGEDANGLFDFQREIEPSLHDVQTPPEGSMYFIGVTADDLDRDFHVLPVRYFGRIDRTDKWVISWRCQRLSESLECRALD